MTPATRKLIEQALQLPDEARAALAGCLIESLDGSVDDDAAAEWEKEIVRRIRELDDGSVKPIPWSEVRRTLSM